MKCISCDHALRVTVPATSALCTHMIEELILNTKINENGVQAPYGMGVRGDMQFWGLCASCAVNSCLRCKPLAQRTVDELREVLSRMAQRLAIWCGKTWDYWFDPTVRADERAAEDAAFDEARELVAELGVRSLSASSHEANRSRLVLSGAMLNDRLIASACGRSVEESRQAVERSALIRAVKQASTEQLEAELAARKLEQGNL